MGSLKIEPACLQCHENQGYQLGDIRGGIRVSIPTDLFQQEVQSLEQHTQKSQLFVIAGASVVLGIFFCFLRAIYRYQKNIEQINQSLEKKVAQRTHVLKKMYQHEKYVKDLLSIISNVNELLLTAISSQSVLQNSVEQLAKHQHYHHTWVGLTQNNCLEIAHQANKNNNILEQNCYDLNVDFTNQQVATALNAIQKNQTIINPYNSVLTTEHQRRRKSDSVVRWFLAIPLQSTNTKQAVGVLAIYSDREQGFETEEINALEKLALDIGLILYSHKQKAILEKMEENRIANYEETILAFVNIIEQRDTYTAGHTIRVAEYCKKIAVALNIDAESTKKLEQAAILHDIGKVATPDAVLLKPSKLSVIEYELIKQHAYAGYLMLSKIDMYKDLADIIRYHHVRYDGKGYPETDNSDEVPFLSYVMAVADAFDAMTSNRIYKPKQTVTEALAEIKCYAGTQFHPQVAEVAINVLADTQITQTTQIPSSELEQKRFSYFFCDSLTELYNENYLHAMTTYTDHKNLSLVLCLLSNFSNYNKQHGWDAGNELLVQLAKEFKIQFPQATVFRYHGDDFVLLFEEPALCDDTIFDKMTLLKDNGIGIEIKHFKLEEGHYSIPF
jgi:putative nucleotidyltransferase with HDIG domain